MGVFFFKQGILLCAQKIRLQNFPCLSDWPSYFSLLNNALSRLQGGSETPDCSYLNVVSAEWWQVELFTHSSALALLIWVQKVVFCIREAIPARGLLFLKPALLSEADSIVHCEWRPGRVPRLKVLGSGVGGCFCLEMVSGCKLRGKKCKVAWKEMMWSWIYFNHCRIPWIWLQNDPNVQFCEILSWSKG